MNLRTHTLLAALALAAAGGCAPDRMSLEPYGICAMPEACSFSGACDGYLLGPVSYNAAAGTFLWQGIELRNQSPNNADLATGRVNSNDAHITSYSLAYSTGGPPGMTFFDGAMTVPAGGSGVIWTRLAAGGALDGYYTVDVTFFGYYDNGREFETEPYSIGLNVVAGTTFPCPKAGDVDVCPGTGAQGNRACGTP
jgi:hypothetical protein